ncbi:hypothetical protein FLONG3_6400 [Fusarium longipes]|uniref:F-box domain-containing protein n=1 Tax=Fusarium longipes TaxID=694270 RepID=A0A395SLY0_9HYPO|nr:hypothetical protein FLONG3_6400 [Fusarium longipes]
MSFEQLPTEMIECIAECLPQSQDLNALCRANRRFNLIVSWHLYHSHARKALHWGASNGYLQVMQKSLNHGVSIHIRDRKDKTPLTRAVEAQNLEAINFLLDRGADINYSKTFAESITYIAVLNRNIDVIKLVLARGANPDALSNNDTLPLFLAVSRGDLEIAQMLVEYGARLDAPGPHQTPMIQSIKLGHHDILKMFIEKGLFRNDKDGSLGAEALTRAVLDQNHKALDILLAAGVNPGKGDWLGYCPIMHALRSGNVHYAIILSDRVEDLTEPKDRRGKTLLDYGVTSHSKQYLKYLVGRGFSPDNPRIETSLEILVLADRDNI